jgi:2-hydroxychromene-2-carboxylate isomerase
MRNPIEFFFDFASPYGYIAATQIGALAKKYDRGVAWRPMLLGAVFKVTGGGPLPSLPLKGTYALRDMPRSARFLGIPFNFPTPFPIATQAPARAVCWIEEHAAPKVEAAVLALYRAYFVDNRDISSAETTADVLAAEGFNRGEILNATSDQAMKNKLRTQTQSAIERGVFGSPYLFVDGEPFWGHDRFDQMERWLREGRF